MNILVSITHVGSQQFKIEAQSNEHYCTMVVVENFGTEECAKQFALAMARNLASLFGKNYDCNIEFRDFTAIPYWDLPLLIGATHED